MTAFKFNAIETHYNGYRFRSRLEARWAVFFDSLGIAYEYEREGYDLEGTRYLPDFWLPELDHFVEIKGQEPDEDELHKARQLALYTNKRVYIIYGNIGTITEQDSPYRVFMEYPPALYVEWENDNATYSSKEIPLPLEIRVLLQRLDEISMEVRVVGKLLKIFPTSKCWGVDDLSNYLNRLQEQHTRLSQLASQLRRYEEDLIAVFTTDKRPATFTFHGQDEAYGYEWMECENCHAVALFPSEPAYNHRCTPSTDGIQINDSPRLIAAYEAARKARFEFGR